MTAQSRPNILLIEDDPDLAAAIMTFYKYKEADVTYYQDAVSALKNMTPHHFDVIVSDNIMPEMSGIEFVKNIRSQSINTPVIMITGSSDGETSKEAMAAGASECLIKPLSFPLFYDATLRAANIQDSGADNGPLIGQCAAFKNIYNFSRKIAQSSTTVLITGESGTGKEVFANAIHNWSPRKNKPFVTVNCSTLPENLLESELFGHAGAAGLFEEAAGGTIFLDEICDLSLSLQGKLLRLLQERKIKRAGHQLRPIDVRVITATHKDLKKEVTDKRFREDLFFRLNVIPVQLPALRERRDDILTLAHFFLKKFNTLNKTAITGFTVGAQEYLLNHPWKGNVRELESTIERATVLCNSPQIGLESLRILDEQNASETTARQDSHESRFHLDFGDELPPMEEVEKKYIQYVLQKKNGVRKDTAKILGIDRKTLHRKLERLNC